MYKIFIDTNIFLDFYRYNNNDNMLKIVEDFSKLKNNFVNTEQSYEEFYRNREKTINEFIITLKSQINTVFYGNFLSSLKDFNKYEKSVKNANIEIQKMINSTKEMIMDLDKDPVNKIYTIYNSSVCYDRNDDIIKNAIMRKYVGNPPTSNKYTCCDEIIWESILLNVKDDLIIVTRDKTFNENLVFLKTEYENKVGRNLIVVNFISEAIKVLGDIPSYQLQEVETITLVNKESFESKDVDEDSTWLSIVYYSLLSLGGKASLNQIYDKVNELLLLKYPEKLSNKDIKATIRGVLQRFSSDSSCYNNRLDLFKNVDVGVWKISNVKKESE